METKEIYLVMVNTDLTEGRGHTYPKYICQYESTARRLAKKACVQGSDGRVEPYNSPKVGNQFLAPYRLLGMSRDDEPMEKKIQKQKQKKIAKEAAIQRAKDLGLSAEDIKLLS